MDMEQPKAIYRTVLRGPIIHGTWPDLKKGELMLAYEGKISHQAASVRDRKMERLALPVSVPR